MDPSRFSGIHPTDLHETPPDPDARGFSLAKAAIACGVVLLVVNPWSKPSPATVLLLPAPARRLLLPPPGRLLRSWNPSTTDSRKDNCKRHVKRKVAKQQQ